MNDQKDIQKNKQTSSQNRHVDGYVRDDKNLDSKDVYSFILKKTEKLVAALYMVTDCMDTDDAIKMRMRLIGVDVLSAAHKISVLSPVEKHTHITSVKLQVSEIISLVSIASTIGFISEMNSRILIKEFGLLVVELGSHQGQIGGLQLGHGQAESRKISDFILSDDMFKIEDDHTSNSNIYKSGSGPIKPKKTMMSFSSNQGLGSLPSKSTSQNYYKGQMEFIPQKEDRAQKIKDIIKDTKNMDGVSIKDISVAFSNCSEKTIQRELNNLVSIGQIKKIGEKRWSRYSLA